MPANAILDPRDQTTIYEEIPAPLIKYIIFEGGGIRGLAYAGLVDILNKVGMLEDIEHVGGSSIGSIAALLVALGCIPEEIKEILDKLPYKSFLEGKDPSILQFLIAVFIKRNFSLTSGNKLKEWLQDLLEKKLGKRNATFRDLANKVKETENQGRKFKYLSITGSNISKNRLEVFNHETKPDMELADALLISCAYPGVIQAVEWNGDLYVDGGLMNSNLPSFLFNQRKYLPKGFEFNDNAANPAVLHIKIDTAEEMGLLWNNYKTKLLKTIYEYCIAILYGMQSRDGEISDQIPTNVVQLFDCDVGTFEVSMMTDAVKLLLLDSGVEGMLEWLYHHFQEAFEIKSYPDEATWLAAKAARSLNEIGELKQYYLKELTKRIDSESEEDKELCIKLEEKIASLTKYIADYSYNINFPDQPVPLEVTPHINVYVEKPRKDIDEKIKIQLENRMAFLDEKIVYLQNLIQATQSRIAGKIDRVSDSAAYEQVIYLNVLQEELKLFENVKRSLMVILNMKCPQLAEHSDLQPLQKTVTQFLAKKTAAWSSHFALMQIFDRDLKNMLLILKEKNDIITLDLRATEDFKLYIMSCMLYLKFIDCNNSDIYKPIEENYQRLFGTLDLPLNMFGLGKLFNKEGADAYVLTHRVENLFKNFAGIDRPKDKHKFYSINIDDIFAHLNNPKWKIENILQKFQEGKRTTEKNPNEIEMTFIYKPFSYTDKFLMFHNVAMQTNMARQNDGSDVVNEFRYS